MIVGVGVNVIVGVAVSIAGLVGMGGSVEVGSPPHGSIVAVIVTVGVIF